MHNKNLILILVDKNKNNSKIKVCKGMPIFIGLFSWLKCLYNVFIDKIIINNRRIKKNTIVEILIVRNLNYKQLNILNKKKKKNY